MAQKRSSGVDAWYFPGLTYQVTPATKLSAQAIWFGDAKAAGVLFAGICEGEQTYYPAAGLNIL